MADTTKTVLWQFSPRSRWAAVLKLDDANWCYWWAYEVVGEDADGKPEFHTATLDFTDDVEKADPTISGFTRGNGYSEWTFSKHVSTQGRSEVEGLSLVIVHLYKTAVEMMPNPSEEMCDE
jgi:hypothetical protein